MSEPENPHDPDEPRIKSFLLKVNDYDLFDLTEKANKKGISKSALLRRGAGMIEPKPGARSGNQNAKKKDNE